MSSMCRLQSMPPSALAAPRNKGDNLIRSAGINILTAHD
jgi:hypothetical protein